MLKDAILTKRCLMVCGGGGVGKTTVAASIAIAAAHVRPRVLVVTIDPAKRLLQAFGFSEASQREGGAPLPLSDEVKQQLGLPTGASLSVAVLNPKYVLDQVLEQTLSEEGRSRLKRTLLYSELSQMVYGLQEYTAYEWVTRMIGNNEYDLIVLDTPPATHAKDFFNAPEKIKNLMESRVFQIFSPKKSSWFSNVFSFSWVEKLLGQKIFNESRIFFETFTALRDRILERCDLLAKFFKSEVVEVVAVGTPEQTAQIELRGLIEFLAARKIPVQTVILNQVDQVKGNLDLTLFKSFLPEIQESLKAVWMNAEGRAERASIIVDKLKSEYRDREMITFPMTYSTDGFQILKKNSELIQK